ncbi:MAG TPA: hypothetical protein VJP40_05720 [bacterium]|nr:hypothetical protein [bacterium]
MIRKFLQRASNIAHSLGHFGRLGKTAATRSFLRKERKKLLVKLGEKAMNWLEQNPESSPDLQRVVAQIRKIDGLLSREDYGGGNGVDFSRQEDRESKAKPGKRRSK